MAAQTREKKLNDAKSLAKKSAKKLREKRLNIRFSEEEFAVIKAKADGMNLARYARAMLTKGAVPRRERDYPKVDPTLLRQLHSMGKNLNQLVRYTHTQANSNRPIDTVNLALALDNMSEQIAQLKKQYQVPENYFNVIEDDSNTEATSHVSTANSMQRSPINNVNLHSSVIG